MNRTPTSPQADVIRRLPAQALARVGAPTALPQQQTANVLAGKEESTQERKLSSRTPRPLDDSTQKPAYTIAPPWYFGCLNPGSRNAHTHTHTHTRAHTHTHTHAHNAHIFWASRG